MKSRYVFLWGVLWLTAVVFGCTKGDPPCAPSAHEVYLEEANLAMRRRTERLMEEARKLEADGRKAEAAEIESRRAMTFTCGYDRMADGRWRKADMQELRVSDIAVCLTDPRFAAMPLHECAAAIARTLFITVKILADRNADPRVALQIASKVMCLEFSREVDVEPEKHGLERTGPDWVQITIFAVVQAIEAVGEAATAPAMFLILPDKSGGIEACVDVDEAPPKRCTVGDGCASGSPDQPPGADSTDTGGVVLPPGSTPGDGSGPSGDP